MCVCVTRRLEVVFKSLVRLDLERLVLLVMHSRDGCLLNLDRLLIRENKKG